MVSANHAQARRTRYITARLHQRLRHRRRVFPFQDRRLRTHPPSGNEIAAGDRLAWLTATTPRRPWTWSDGEPRIEGVHRGRHPPRRSSITDRNALPATLMPAGPRHRLCGRRFSARSPPEDLVDPARTELRDRRLDGAGLGVRLTAACAALCRSERRRRNVRGPAVDAAFARRAERCSSGYRQAACARGWSGDFTCGRVSLARWAAEEGAFDHAPLC